MNQLEKVKHRTQVAVMNNRAAIRRTVDAGEVLAGSFAGGYIAGQYPTVAGVPTDAGLGLVMLTTGIALKQRDMTALGLGMMSGYVHNLGREVAATSPIMSMVG